MKKIFRKIFDFLKNHLFSIIIIALLIYQYYFLTEQKEDIKRVKATINQVRNSISGSYYDDFSYTSVIEKLDDIEMEIQNIENILYSIESDVSYIKFR
ncbi:MAG: hypothetical protein RDU14_15225 [Melioribacteraceae bacterium]|nr:hypothetical protein [Melioribacteraceae bacterium]